MEKITNFIIPFTTKLKLPKTLKPSKNITISIRKGSSTIYDDGCNRIIVPIWGYKGQYPGPIIETQRDQTINVNWVNDIESIEKNPCKADQIEVEKTQLNVIPQNVLDPEKPDALLTGEPSMGAGGKAFVSTHLHGGKIAPNYDGWPESMLLPREENDEGQSRLCQYENKQRAMMLWYHDHAMHTTRLNAYAGLAGLWIIRDKEEKKLKLPQGKFEIPLVIQDRNLTDINKFSSRTDRARLLHRVETPGPLEFFGPLTLVNGSIWPKHDVHPEAYRLRILNGSNARFYRLRFAEKNDNGYKWLNVPVKQIGSDCGLLNTPVNLPKNGLVIAPAERVDLIVNFSNFKGKNIVLLNTAEAPFSNENPPELIDDLFPVDPANDERRVPYPEVMMFCIKNGASKKKFDFKVLAKAMKTEVVSFTKEDPLKRISKKKPPVTRTAILVEKSVLMDNGMEQVILVQWELAPKAEIIKTKMAILAAQREIHIDGEEFLVTAERFQDPVNWFVEHGATEKWRFINLTADTHPMHVHLVQFRTTGRTNVTVEGVVPGDETKDVVTIVNEKSIANLPIVISTGKSGVIDANEKGYKDTIRVNPGEMVEMVATFEGYCGRYVYHCHLLEHEDHDMMRQFVVTRNDIKMDEHHSLPISVGEFKSCK